MPCPETVATTEAATSKEKIALPLPNRVPQLRTAQGIDEACKTVLRVTAAATRLVNLMRACMDASGSGVLATYLFASSASFRSQNWGALNHCLTL
jgi:hypothetical protein